MKARAVADGDARRRVQLRVDATRLLPIGRTPFFLAELAPGLTDHTPNQNQVTMGGGFAYDNKFLVDGVDVNDNVFGQPNGLFIEEGIQEVQVLTSGISAEYGRFGGGVVNVITRSGGNMFSGAFRTNLTNASWSEETPLERSRGTTRASKLSPTYEAIAGGPVDEGSALVLRRRPRRAHDHLEPAAADRRPLYRQEQQPPLRGQADRHAGAGPDPAGHLHRQPHRAVRGVAPEQHRPARADDADDEQPSRRGDVARRDRRPRVRDGAVLAEVLAGLATTAAPRPTSSNRRS